MTRSALAALPAFALVLSAATPALAAPHWTLNTDAREATLTTDEGSGEDSATSLTCKAHKGQVGVIMFVSHEEGSGRPGADGGRRNKAGQKPPWATQMTVASGAVSARLPGKASPDEMNGGTEVETSLPTTAPVLVEFAKTGKLRLTAYGEASKDPSVPVAKAAKFLAACSK